MKVLWNFTVEYDPANDPTILGNHIFAPAPEHVEELGRLADLRVGRSSSSPRLVLRIELFEGDPRLALIISAIRERLGYSPGPWLITPQENRCRFYSIRKIREYTRNDLDGASFLSLFADKPIANHQDGTAEQVEREIYVARADRLQSAKTQFGALFPFQGLCVTEVLGRQLEQAGLRAISLESVVILPENKVRKPLLQLSSCCVAPRSLLPLINDQGHQVQPNTECSCYLDDGGYQPHEFKYRTPDLEEFRKTDIAVSYERTGVNKARAYRWCIVSQQFRRVMAELKVTGLRYAPVRFVS
ncbi:MAG TPA: hypothetical protein VN673_11495 [Clostridia bacterium]|nr:hypothetical protein [Clostridia bacterium]